MKATESEKRIFVVCPNPSIDIMAEVPSIEVAMTNRIKNENMYPGGKGLHVALALGELGLPCTLVGFWGEENGRWLKNRCKHYQSNLETVGPTVIGWNRSCYTFQSDSEWQDTELLGIGPTITPDDFDQLFALIQDRKHEIHSLAICGSWPKGASPTYTKELASFGRANGIQVFLDCTGPHLKHALETKPYGVHLNRHEVSKYFDVPFDKARKLIMNYCQISAITDGAKGLYLASKVEELHAFLKLDHVHSTIGSGDCLLAGIMAYNFLNYDMTDMAKIGVACGAANCIEKNLGMFNKSDVKDLFRKVSLSSSILFHEKSG